VLGGGVGGHVRRGKEADHGGEVDDASASLSAQVRQDGLGHAHHTEDVDVEHVLGLRDGDFLNGADCAHAGVVDQDVEPPEPLDHLPDRGRDRRIAGHVEIEESHAVERVDARGVAARADHVEPCCDQRECGCFPDAG
jgi:hypothetical protein